MGGRSAREALDNHVSRLRAAQACLTHPHLVLSQPAGYTVQNTYAVALNDLDPVALPGAMRLRLTVGQFVRIVASDPDDPRGPCDVRRIGCV